LTDNDGDVPDSHAELPLDPDADILRGRPSHLQAGALLWVFCGGVLGTALRYTAEDLLPHDGSRWPWATFTVNLVGAFVLGALLEGLARAGDDSGWRRRARLLAGTGFCGALTTYSTFAYEISLLGKGSHVVTAVGYGLGSVVGGVIAAWLGIVVAAGIRRRRVPS
jgi:CrcB protein